MGVGVENQPGEETYEDKIISVIFFYLVDECIREHQDRGDRKNPTCKIDDVIDRKGIGLVREKTS